MSDTDSTPTYDPKEALEYLGGLADTALDTMKPAVKAACLKLAQGHVNAIGAQLARIPDLIKTADELRAKVAALEVVANAPETKRQPLRLNTESA